jgi:hypothetical protein
LIAQNVVERDLRIDFFRGLALYMILVDHVFGDPFSRLTYQNFGFSDAAEIFVFLSGVSCGIVYPRILSRRGWSGLMAAVIKRSAQIYAYYVLSSIAVILLLKAAAGSINNARVSDLSIVTLREESFSAIRSTIFLTSPPDLPGILVLYLILTFFVIPLFLKGAEFTAALTLAASGLVWIVSQIVPNFLPGLADHSYFNPLAWQFLFSIGMFVGIKYNLDSPVLLSRPVFKWLVRTAWAIVIFSFLYRFSNFFSSKLHLDLGWFRIGEMTHVQMKENLSPVRLLHFLSVVLLVTTFVKSSNPIFGWAGSKAVISTGRCSLEVFSMTAILSVLLSVLAVVGHPSLLEKVVLDGVAIMSIALTALALTGYRQSRQNLLVSRLGNQSASPPRK